MKQTIFISYAYQDKPYVDRVRRELAELGVMDDDAVMLDAVDLDLGDDFRKAIRERIKAANKVVIIATENAMMSKWVNYEVGMAEALGKQIVVVGKRGSDKSSLPMYLKRLGDVQAVELEAEGMDLD